MSCCNHTPCGATPTDNPCVDPGMDATGKHLMVLDSQFCARRLENQTGFLYYGQNGLRFSDSPHVPLAELSVGEGDSFGSLVICTGSNGVWRRVVPAAGVDGYLKADGAGGVAFSDPDSFSIPDPMTLDTLNVTTLNAEKPTFSGVPTFTGLNSDTVVSPVGLNAANQLVKGQQQLLSVAMYHETENPAGGGTPNWNFPSSRDALVKCNVELYDPDGIAHPVGDMRIVIDKPGDYIIEWYGTFTGYVPSATGGGEKFNPGLWLNIGGQTKSYGNGPVSQDQRMSGTASGIYIAAGLVVGSEISLYGAGMRSPSSGRGTGLQGVTLILTKLR